MTTYQNNMSNLDINYSKIIQDFIENFFLNITSSYHQNYITHILLANRVDSVEINEIYNNAVIYTLEQEQKNIHFLIKNNNFKLSTLFSLIDTFTNKIIRINNILKINTINNDKIKYINIITSDQLIINYIESILINQENINDIIKLIKIIKISENSFYWFLKFMGITYKNNFKTIKILNIPYMYSLLYELNYIIDYINKITQIYSFLQNDLFRIIEPFNDILYNKIYACIENANLIELLNFIIDKKVFIINNQNTQKIININLNEKMIKIKKNDYYQVDSILKICIKSNSMNILGTYLLFFFKNEDVLKIVFQIINNNINKDLEYVKNIISILIIHKQDYFLKEYYTHLIRRLLSMNSNINDEKSLISFMIERLGEKNILLNKINQVSDDYKIAINNLDFYKQKNTLNYNLNIIITSYANWNINYNDGYFEIKNENSGNLVNCLIKYNEYYKVIFNNNYKLLWLIDKGIINMTFNNIEIICLPIQFMILELFDFEDFISHDYIFNLELFKNYSNKFKNDIIQSLITGNILIENNNNLSLNYNSNIKSNLVEQYLLCKNKLEIVKKITNTIAHNCNDVVKTLINHYCKINPVNINNLFNILNDKITQFNFDRNLFDKVIAYMINMDYIIIENNNCIKCIY